MVYCAKKKDDAEKEEAAEAPSLLILDSSPKTKKIRIVSLYGDINEEKAEESILSLIALREYGANEVYANPDDPESEVVSVEYEPIEVLVSTWGGSAMDMFAIYDAIRFVREDCNVVTTGVGKVMSAGVLLLAAGTKGYRRIGKNCRVMLHSVIGGNHGSLHKLENEMEEIRWIQERHIDSLVAETNMTKRYIKKVLDRKVNAYIGAEEAVELGIADVII